MYILNSWEIQEKHILSSTSSKSLKLWERMFMESKNKKTEWKEEDMGEPKPERHFATSLQPGIGIFVQCCQTTKHKSAIHDL